MVFNVPAGHFLSGTTKGKIDGHDIWVVEIKMPKELIGNFKYSTNVQEPEEEQQDNLNI